MYEKISKNDYAVNYLTEETKLDSEKFSDMLAKNFYDGFTKALNVNTDQNEHKSRISKSDIEKMKANRLINQDRTVVDTSQS